MKSGLKVMMVSEGNDFGQTCAGVLRSYGCDVKMVPKNGAERNAEDETRKEAFNDGYVKCRQSKI